MPLQNRVLPSGDIIADPARGLFTGNRGILHDGQKRLGKARWKGKLWIICALEFKGWHREVMTPGTWTELFFLDEAVALAAGHRPCALCQREAYYAYRTAWGGGRKAVEIDAALHAARIGPDRQQRHFMAEAKAVPDGAFIRHEGQSCLIHSNALHPYNPSGYGPPLPLPKGQVEVMTPQPTIEALRAGYRPLLHPSVTRPLPDGAV